MRPTVTHKFKDSVFNRIKAEEINQNNTDIENNLKDGTKDLIIQHLTCDQLTVKNGIIAATTNKDGSNEQGPKLTIKNYQKSLTAAEAVAGTADLPVSIVPSNVRGFIVGIEKNSSLSLDNPFASDSASATSTTATVSFSAAYYAANDVLKMTIFEVI